MVPSNALRGSLLTGAMVLFTACASVADTPTAATRPNVVYVFPDQWRSSATGYSGNTDVLTPNIDRLAGESLNFRNTVATAPVCGPYRAVLMTGRYPTSTGYTFNDLHLPAEEYTFAEIFADAGYNTAYIGKWHLDGMGRSAYIPPERRQGWQFWMAAECDHKNHTSHYFTGDSDERQFWEGGYDVFAQTRAVQDYLRAQTGADKPFVLMMSWGPPHPASDAPPKEFFDLYNANELTIPPNVPEEKHAQTRGLLHRYYAHCSAIDHAVGELLKTLDDTGLAENTIFIFTADHGGMLWSHGDPQEWKQVHWSESAHVPFLLRYPALHGTKARTVETPLGTTDILPTLLSLAGVERPGTLEGTDLSSLIRDGVEIPDRAALYMSVTPFVGQGEPYRSIRTVDHTYVRGLEGPWMLFNDHEDPFQMRNLLEEPEFAELGAQMDARLQAELDRIGGDFRRPEAYVEAWGYQVDHRFSIPYSSTPREPQTPPRHLLPQR